MLIVLNNPMQNKQLQPKNNLGFTLIELLIVIVIISIVSCAAVLSISFNQNKRLEQISNQLVNTFKLAEQEAMLRPATLGFTLNANTFQFYIFKGAWQPISDSVLGLHHVPKNVKMTLKINGETITSKTPQLIISSSGDITPFTLFIGKTDTPPRYKIVGNADGTLKSEMVNEDEEE